MVLRRLSVGDGLKNVTHVVVDEVCSYNKPTRFIAEDLYTLQVHERSVDGDFLLLELKELLDTHPTLKVILMSATINQETFVNYFNGAPLLSIPGMTHPVTDKYGVL